MEDSSKKNRELYEENSRLKDQLKKLAETEIKLQRAEEAWKESEARYRQLFDNSQSGIYRVDFRTGKFIQVNEVFCRYVGYSQEEIATLSPYDILTEESKQLFLARLEKMLRGVAVPAVVEYEIVAKDGRKRFVHLHNRNIYDAEGRIVAADVVGHDITDRKQVEAALRRSEKFFRTITENASDVIFIVDALGTISYASPSMERIVGYRPDELVGKNAFDRIIPEDVPRATEDFRKDLLTIETAIPNSFRVFHKNGSVMILEGTGLNLLHDPIIAGMVINLRDVTERRRAEEELKKSEELLRLITANMSDMIRISDMQGNNLYVSPSHEKGLGYRPEERLGKSNFDIVHPEDLEGILTAFSEGLTANRRVTAESRARHADGHYIWLETVGDLLRDDQGNATAVVMSSRDVTGRKQAEEEKRKLEEHLQRMEKLESIGTLAGGIAHDFNNLLMGIQGYASLCLLTVSPADPNSEKLKRIGDLVQSGADLTRQLLGFSRGGRYEVKLADITEIIENTISMFERTSKEIIIHRKYAPGLWLVEVDRGQMEQVFMNLYVNARQAMPGGGELYLAAEMVPLDEDMTLRHDVPAGKYVKITVGDTGTGMDDKTRERIFDPFFTTKEMGRGTGLGLAMVYGIVKGHGGIIEVDSELGEGTTFTIYLRASKKGVVEKQPETKEIMRGMETILLVDDEPIVREVNRDMLTSLGYRVYTAAGGQEALAVFAENAKDIRLVILDMIMPGLNGGETFDQLREISSEVVVLLSSGYSIDGEAKKILTRGCNGFLQKPFHLQTLSRKLRELLDGGETVKKPQAP